MIFNRSLEKIILSYCKNNLGVIFVGPKGSLKLFSSEIIINSLLKDYSSYIPFNHNDIFFVGTYYYKLFYKFFEKNIDKVFINETLRDLFIRFVGICIANRKLVDDKGITSDIVSLITSIKNGKELKKEDTKKLLENLEIITSKLSKIQSIGIDTIRDIIQFSNRTSLSGYKFIIISEFDNATTEAQNALLKTLEEPPKGVFFILTTSKYDKILPTIRSRTFKVSFLKPKGKEIKEMFDNIIEIDEDKYYSIYDLMMENVYKINTEFLERFLKVMFSNNLEEAMNFIDEVIQEEELVEKFFEVANNIITSLLEVRARIAGLNVPINKEIISNIPKEFIHKLTISKLYNLQSLLNNGYSEVYTFNINPKFVFTNFFVEVFS